MSLDEAVAHPREGKLRVLSLDGGGIRGLSSLLVLDALMKQIDPISPPKPCEVFDLIGGTSTGGLIAIMLGRLNMDMASCIRAYRDMSESIFKPRETLNIAAKVLAKYYVRGRFSSSALEKAIKTVIVSTGKSVDELMYPGIEQKCKIFVCAVSRECPGVIRFRNYRPSGPAPLNPRIWEAARATSAATSFFDPIAIGPFGQEFLDGATGANNPVEIALEEARDIWPNAMPRLQYIISIGTGEPSLSAFGNNLMSIGRTLVRISTDANAVATQFARAHPELAVGGDRSRHIYQRFNVSKGLENIKLHETAKTSEIASATHRYLDEDEQRARLRAFGAALQVGSSTEAQHHGQMPSGVIHFTFDGVTIVGGATLTGTCEADATIKDIHEKYLSRRCQGISLQGAQEIIPYATPRIHATITSGPCSYDRTNPLINENVPIDLYFNRLLGWKPAAMKVQIGSLYRDYKTVFVGDDLRIRFVRTVRLPESKSPHKLPIGFGGLPLFEMSELQKSVRTGGTLPEHMREKGGLIMPMYRNEAMFLSFQSKRGTYAIRPFVGGVNTISGHTFVPNMATAIRESNKIERKQDYVVVTPDAKTTQKWLDGARTGRGVVRQFAAVSGASELSIEHQVTGTNDVGGLQFEIIPKHESCYAGFWPSVFGQQKLSVQFLATPKDVGLVPGCRIYANTLEDEYPRRRMVTVRDILHDSQTLKILASKRTPPDSNSSPESELSLLLRPFGIVDDPFVLEIFDRDFKFLLSLPKPLHIGYLEDRALCLAGLGIGQLKFDSQRIGRHTNVDDLGIVEGDRVGIYPEEFGGGGHDAEIDLSIGTGAEIIQAILPDTLDPRAWDVKRGVLFNVQILDSASFERLTGLSPPCPPIAFQSYIKRKYPFLSLKEQEDTSTPVKLGHLKPVSASAVLDPDATTSSCLSLPGGTVPANAAKRPRRNNAAHVLPGYCHSCEQVYTRANQYTPCGHITCLKCASGDDNDFFDGHYYSDTIGKWKCCICGSKECTLVESIHDVQPQEPNKMCEKFRSVFDVDGTDTTWAYDSLDRETGGLDMDVGKISKF